VRILIADGHRLFLKGIAKALDGTDVEVVAQTHDGRAVPPLVNELRPHAALLDLQLPGLDGIACLELLRKRYPDVKTVLLAASDEDRHVWAAAAGGAYGYILKSIDSAEFASALRRALESPVFEVLGRRTDDRSRGAREAGLTERQVTILGGVARGLSNRAIARELWVTEQTVKFHLTEIFKKLGVHNRTQAARAAYGLGVVASPLFDAA